MIRSPNATVEAIDRVGESLYLIEVAPNTPPRFRAGQYLELAFPRQGETWLNRHYSIASPPSARTLQLYISAGEDDVPSVWPKLGEPLWVSGTGLGVLSREALTPGRLPVLVATGTGIAPFLSMLRERPITPAVLLQGVRHAADLGFADELRAIEGLRYIPIISRERAPEGGHSGHVQDLLAPEPFHAFTGATFSPSTVELLLCGNPAMIRDLAVRLSDYALTYDRYW